MEDVRQPCLPTNPPAQERGAARSVAGHRLSFLTRTALCAIVLAGCASAKSQGPETLPGSLSGSTLNAAALNISSEPSVQVHEVSAVYLSVAPRFPRWKLCAVAQSGECVEPLPLEDAIARAGSASELAGQLSQLPPNDDKLLALIPGTEPFVDSHCQDSAECIFWTVGSVLLIPTWPIAWLSSRDSFHRLYYGRFPGLGLREDEPAPMKGYAFFPNGTYATIEYSWWTSYDPFNPTSGLQTARVPWR